MSITRNTRSPHKSLRDEQLNEKQRRKPETHITNAKKSWLCGRTREPFATVYHEYRARNPAGGGRCEKHHRIRDVTRRSPARERNLSRTLLDCSADAFTRIRLSRITRYALAG